jgi:sterol desaturase/sphingolipid hydroxylase (fatty acid hydroxylase superfamily)
VTFADTLEDLLLAAGMFAVLLIVFRPLERRYPAWPEQRFFRSGWGTDLCFMFGHYLLWIPLLMVILTDFIPWAHTVMPRAVRAAVNRQPFWVQVLEVVLLGDLLIYWGHRLQHRVDFLWRFHAVHHTSEKLDWLAAHREHPLDTLYSVILMNLPAYMLGFGSHVLISFISFRGMWAIFIHSNVRIPLGPFAILFGSPAFHHWHHARDRHDCNYGNVSPLMDVLFGTHYDPGHEPEALGLPEGPPPGYAGLIVKPLLPRPL